MILLRTTQLGPETLAFGDALRAASGQPLAVLVDERTGSVGDCRFPKLSLNKKTYGGLGLHLPGDVGWRCGDYGFYLARRHYPQVEHFWMIEDDVRITGDTRLFFERFAARPEFDLLAARLRPAGLDWWWWAHLASSDAKPYRCFFPVVRLSGRAIDTLYAKRRRHSRLPSRIALWPNDEAFVATTIARSRLNAADLNALGRVFYDEETFSYENVLNGDNLPPSGPAPRLLHPVLFGDRYGMKIERRAREATRTPMHFRIRRAAVRRVNTLLGW